MTETTPYRGAGALADRPHVLYRVFDVSGRLLYVGMTLNIASRFSTHRRDRPWWTGAATITLEHFANRAAVETAERKAIEDEAPVHNIRYSPAVLLSDDDDRVSPQFRDDPIAFQVLDAIESGREDAVQTLNACGDPEHRSRVAQVACTRLERFLGEMQAVVADPAPSGRPAVHSSACRRKATTN